jgi:hypothetical protein
MMKKTLLFSSVAVLFFVGFNLVKAQNNPYKMDKEVKVVYFNPEVFPNIDEIKTPTNEAFFDAVSDNFGKLKRGKFLKAENETSFEEIDTANIIDYCRNNNADFAVVPRVKYFKVGIGKYVFSNQVIVSMKLFDADGKFVTEASYDTYKKNMRLMGNTKNSIKLGTNGVFKEMIKKLKAL